IDSEISVKRKDADQVFAEQQLALDRQKGELDRQRQAIEKNLSSVVKSFREEKDKLITDFLAISPILESAGVFGGITGTENSAANASKLMEPPAAVLSLPPALARDGSRVAALDEEEFFDR